MTTTPGVVVGFTGTQHGCTEPQLGKLMAILANLPLTTPGQPELHHGDCQGADDQAHRIAGVYGYRIVVNPPTDQRRAMGHQGDLRQDPKPYLIRDDNIAMICWVLVACPDGPERLRSGTWATIRRARKYGRRIIIIWPDGTTTEEPAREAAA